MNKVPLLLLCPVSAALGLTASRGGPTPLSRPEAGLQGYFAPKTRPPPQDPTVGSCTGPYGGPRGGAVSYERGTPVSHACNGSNAHPDTRDDTLELENLGQLGQGEPASG